MIPLKGAAVTLACGGDMRPVKAEALPVASVEQGVGSLHTDWLGSFKGLLLPPSHSSFLSRAREVSSCNVSRAGSSYCGDSRITTLAGICLEEWVLVGLQRYLIPEEKVHLEGMRFCLSSHALTLRRRATAPRGWVPAVGCLSAWVRGWPRAKAWCAAGRRWWSHGAPALQVGGCNDSAGAETVQSQAGRRCWFDQWK